MTFIKTSVIDSSLWVLELTDVSFVLEESKLFYRHGSHTFYSCWVVNFNLRVLSMVCEQHVLFYLAFQWQQHIVVTTQQFAPKLVRGTAALTHKKKLPVSPAANLHWAKSNLLSLQYYSWVNPSNFGTVIDRMPFSTLVVGVFCEWVLVVYFSSRPHLPFIQYGYCSLIKFKPLHVTGQ